MSINDTNFGKSSKNMAEMIKSVPFAIHNKKNDEDQLKLEQLEMSELNSITGGNPCDGVPNCVPIPAIIKIRF